MSGIGGVSIDRDCERLLADAGPVVRRVLAERVGAVERTRLDADDIACRAAYMVASRFGYQPRMLWRAAGYAVSSALAAWRRNRSISIEDLGAEPVGRHGNHCGEIECAEVVRDTLRRMSADLSRIVRAAMSGADYGSIAEREGISLRTVHRRLQQAQRIIRSNLANPR